MLKKILVNGILVASLMMPAISWAASGNPNEISDDEWQFTLAFPMIWAPSITGNISGTVGTPPVNFEVPFSDIFDSLEMGLMGEFYASRGRFGMAFKFNYLNVANASSYSGSIVNANLDTDIVMGVNDLLASWNVHKDVELVAGIRHIHAKIDVKIEATVFGDPAINQEFTAVDTNQIDYLIGLNYGHFFNNKWGVTVMADAAVAGDSDRDYSIDVRGLYHMSDLNNVWIGWRYMNIGNDSTDEAGVVTQVDMSQSGPMLGWAFTF